jgi:hypothetical protein
MLAARLAGLALAFGLAALPSRAVAPAVAGPPLLCFPLDIGGAATLPFGGEGFDVKSDLSTAEVVKQAHAILEKSDDPLVHMETLRRATIWFMSRNEGPREDRSADASRGESAAAARFRAALSDSVLVAAAAPEKSAAAKRRAALGWFDLGYFQAAARQGGALESTHERDFLEKSVALAPDDVALRFGVALAEYFPVDESSGQAWAGHMAKVFEAKAPPELVKKNAVATLGAFLHAPDWEKLGAEVQKRLGRA